MKIFKRLIISSLLFFGMPAVAGSTTVRSVGENLVRGSVNAIVAVSRRIVNRASQMSLQDFAQFVALIGILAAAEPAWRGIYSSLYNTFSKKGRCGEDLDPEIHGFQNFVGGIPEDIEELVDMLNEDEDDEELIERRKRLGVEVTRAILLLGPPGNGKTTLARAVAAEANAGFFVGSGADIVGLIKYTGEGVRAVKNLFKQAANSINLCGFKKSIIFIDEIDAIGRSRRENDPGSSEEMRALFTELLSQMEGFSNNPNVIVIAATNTANQLDGALLSRFPAQIFIPNPSPDARKNILLHFLNKKRSRIDPAGAGWSLLVEESKEFSARDLRNSVDRAARTVVRRKSDVITFNDMVEAIADIKRAKEVAQQSLIGREPDFQREERRPHVIIKKQINIYPPWQSRKSKWTPSRRKPAASYPIGKKVVREEPIEAGQSSEAAAVR